MRRAPRTGSMRHLLSCKGDLMRRREFITLFGCAAVAWPRAARAQQSAKIPRIGYLGLFSATASLVEALRAGLSEVGYVDGRNVIIEFRWADSPDEPPRFAAEFVTMNVNVIFANSSTYVEAARHATSTIPIVFAAHADPVGLGHIASLSRPGGNITGMSMLMTELSVKELELVNEAIPHATRIGVFWNPTTPSHPLALQAVEAAGRKRDVQLVMVTARTIEDFSGAFIQMKKERVDGFLVISSTRLWCSRLGRLASSSANVGIAHILQWFRSPRSQPRKARLRSSVSSRSVLARRCSRGTATLEA